MGGWTGLVDGDGKAGGEDDRPERIGRVSPSCWRRSDVVKGAVVLVLRRPNVGPKPSVLDAMGIEQPR